LTSSSKPNSYWLVYYSQYNKLFYQGNWIIEFFYHQNLRRILRANGFGYNYLLTMTSFTYYLKIFVVSKNLLNLAICITTLIFEIFVELDCLFTFLLFCCVKKRKESLWNIFFLITQPFLYLEGALKLISQEQFKTTTTKIFQVRQQFRGSSKISTHRIWDGEHIKQNRLLLNNTKTV
jgi:hypothetical protein